MSRVYITGDTHFITDIDKLVDFYSTGGCAGLTRSDYMIICGDFGAEWNDTVAKDLRDIYSEFPWMTLFVDGNHENHARLNALPVEEWHGGNVHRLGPNIIHLMRGEIYDICGKSCFTMGGATSVDRARRTPYVSWWPEELPYPHEYTQGWRNLEKHNFKVNYIFTHCAPAPILEKYYPNYFYEKDALNDFLGNVYRNVTFDHWYCGHYHQDVSLENNFHVCYNVIRRLMV